MKKYLLYFLIEIKSMNSSISSPYPLQRGIALCSALTAMILMLTYAKERKSIIYILSLTAMGCA
jgi:hypothetical protein